MTDFAFADGNHRLSTCSTRDSPTIVIHAHAWADFGSWLSLLRAVLLRCTQIHRPHVWVVDCLLAIVASIHMTVIFSSPGTLTIEPLREKYSSGTNS